MITINVTVNTSANDLSVGMGCRDKCGYVGTSVGMRMWICMLIKIFVQFM